MRHTAFLLAFFAMTALAQEKTPVKIQTEHGTVEWNESDGRRIAQIIREISPEETQDLRADAAAAVSFVERYAPKEEKVSHPLDALDFAFAGWLASSDPRKESSERVVRILGAAYGYYCIEHLGVRWAWTKDEWGEEISLVRDDPEARGFPFTSIRYRIADGKTDFIYALFASLEHLIRETSEKGQPNQAAKPNRTTVTSPAGAGDRVSGAPGSP